MVDTEGYKNTLPQRMLSVQEVASFFHIHPNTIRRWTKKGLLKSYSIGPQHSLRFKQEDVIDFLDKSQSRVHTARG